MYLIVFNKICIRKQGISGNFSEVPLHTEIIRVNESGPKSFQRFKRGVEQRAAWQDSKEARDWQVVMVLSKDWFANHHSHDRREPGRKTLLSPSAPFLGIPGKHGARHPQMEGHLQKAEMAKKGGFKRGQDQSLP